MTLKFLLWACLFTISLGGTQEAHARFLPPKHLVRIRDHKLVRDRQPYYFVGTNLWFAMNLGSTTNGDRPRLIRELDRLKHLGITNLRILAASEGPDSEPWRIHPALQQSAGVFNEHLLVGLDFALAEIAKRHMTAVLVLNNFWPWSGGMAQYLRWAGEESIPYPPPAENGSWDTYQTYTAQFYSNARAVELSNAAIRKIIRRRNTITHKKYIDDPTIMSWELANEPRGVNNVTAFNHWIKSTSDMIRELDRHHLITIGSEGFTPNPHSAGLDVIQNHSYSNIDYITAHVWAQNWGWYEPSRHNETYEAAVARVDDYIERHVQAARYIGKPIVFEEFGIGRDEGSFAVTSTTTVRDQYYEHFFTSLYNRARNHDPVFGVNFWAWSGEARPRIPGGVWQDGDSFIGDPPHEFQGWYGVYDNDYSTQQVIRQAAAYMNTLRNSSRRMGH